MVSRAELRRLRGTVDGLAARRADRPDTAALGDLVVSNSHARVYLDADGTSALLVRGGGVLRVEGLDLRCVAGDCSHDHSAPATQQPEAVSRGPAVATQPSVSMDQQEAAPVQPRPNPYARQLPGTESEAAEAEGIREVMRDRRGY